MKELRGHSILSKTTKEVPDAPKIRRNYMTEVLNCFINNFKTRTVKVYTLTTVKLYNLLSGHG